MREKDEQWAIFWLGLLQPVLYEEDLSAAQRGRRLRAIAGQVVRFPDGELRRPSLSTLRRKLRKYRDGRFKALARKKRNDRGRARATPADLLAIAVKLKQDLPSRSARTINEYLQARHGRTIPRSTLYRHLKGAGATRIKLGISKKKVRRRWTRDEVNELWVGDFADGPYVQTADGSVVPTYLSVFIDCRSRFVVEARYYLRENLDILTDSLLRAWGAHGRSREIYLDNAKIYHARALKAACYQLGIKLTYRTAGDPAGGGLVERIIRDIQAQFEAEVRAGRILTLDQLNQYFAAWLEVSYHQSRHREIGQTPRECYEKGKGVHRPVDLAEIIRFFFNRDPRRVDPDFSDVRIDGCYYRVDPKLRGDKVLVCWDPYGDRQEVLLYAADAEDQYLGKGVLHHRESGAPVKPATAGGGKKKYDLLGVWLEQHDKQVADQVRGIDFHRLARRPRLWPFNAFCDRLAGLLGRKGGLSAFQAGELEFLQKFYQRYQPTEVLLTKAFESLPPQEKTLPQILAALQRLNLQTPDSNRERST